jgi:hypothetical protein
VAIAPEKRYWLRHHRYSTLRERLSLDLTSSGSCTVADVINLEDLNKTKRVPGAIATIPLCELPNSANSSSVPSIAEGH